MKINLFQIEISANFLLFLIILIISAYYPVYAEGSAYTKGDIILKTDQVRNLTGADGSGVIVGVISNGAKGFAESLALGDLSETTVIMKDGKKSEGTAMMEIIHDIAPNATILYHDFGGGKEEKFIEAFENLIKAGATIIAEDVGNYEVPYFEDGKIASAIDKILLEHPEVIIVSSAGNLADIHYQGLYTNQGDGYHSFNGSSGIPLEIKPGGRLKAILEWDDPFDAASNDYDLYLYDVQSNSDIAQSTKVQTEKEKPLEKIDYQNLGENVQKAEVRINAKEGKSSNFSRLELLLIIDKDKTSIDENYLVPQDSIIGWAAIPGVISVAAVSTNNDLQIQKFSSQGSVTISYPSLVIRKKPDITGTDEVDVSGSGGFTKKFTGTSAAAPHIAGLLALIKSIYPEITADVLRENLFSSATDLGDQGWDAVYGYGMADAMKLYSQLKNLGEKEVNTVNNQTPITPQMTISPSIIQNQIKDDNVITEPIVISEPGRYTLGEDITDYSDSIITITNSDVTIDGAGHTISGISIRFGTEAPIMQTGILIWSPQNVPLSNITIMDVNITGTYSAISAKQVKNLMITGCGLAYNTMGIDLSGVQTGIVQDNIIIGNGYAGIYSDSESTNMECKNNQVSNNLYGIILDGSTACSVTHNTITGNHYDGLKLDHGVSQGIFENNFCAGNRNGGISLYSSLKNNIINNTCEQNNPSGILLYESSENSITGNNLLKNIRGINCYYSDGNDIASNNIIGNDATGIMFQPSGHNRILQNRIIGNMAEGILITNTVGADQQNLIANNYLENFQNVRVQEGAKPNYRWNEKTTSESNIIGGSIKGGNAWSLPDGSGYSQTCQDQDIDGICDLPYTVISGNIDEVPLKYTGQSFTPGELAKLGPASEPKTAEDWVTRGKILMGSSDYTGAIEAYDKAISLAPTNYQAWRDKALCLKELKRYDEALSTLNSIMSIYPDNPELWSTAGDIYLVDLQKYPESIPFFEKAISLNNQDTHSLVNLAFAYDKSGNSELALELYRKTVDINPSLTDAWNKAGNILTRAEQFDDAIRMYNKALEIDPGNAYVLNNKGYSLYLAGKFPESVETLQKAITIDTDYKDAWKNLGAVYTAMGRITDAEAAYQKSS